MSTQDDDENLTPEEREFARLVNESLNLFVLPAPPEHLTPHMAQIALRRLIHLDQQLGQETMRVMLGVHQLDPVLGEQMVGLIPTYFGGYQDEIKEIIDKLEGIEQEQSEEPS